jgi:iron complex transport system permease protein
MALVSPAGGGYDVDRMVLLTPRCRVWSSPSCAGPAWRRGCVLQQVLRNPLASPTTLGIDAGAGWRWRARLPRAVVARRGRDLVALAGSASPRCSSLPSSGSARLHRTVTVLAGLIVSLYCARSAMLVLRDRPSRACSSGAVGR